VPHSSSLIEIHRLSRNICQQIGPGKASVLQNQAPWSSTAESGVGGRQTHFITENPSFGEFVDKIVAEVDMHLV
jgi:hypothetical protein